MGAVFSARTVDIATIASSATIRSRVVVVVARERAIAIAIGVVVGIAVAHAATIFAGSDGCSIVVVMVATTARIATRATARTIVATRAIGASAIVRSRRRSVSARIPTIVVVIVIGVVMRIRGRKRAWSRSRTKAGGRRHRRHETVVVVAVIAGPRVEARTWRQDRHYPSRIARAVPREADWLKVLKRGEGVQVVAHFIVRHNRINDGWIQPIGHNVEGDSLDLARADLHVPVGVFGAVIGIEVDADISLIGIVSNVLHVVIDRDRVVVIHYHGL